MSKHEREELDVYVIPPNFIEGGKLFGGMFKMRNAIEAGILAGGCGILVFKLPVSLTAKIIILCVTSLPLAIFGLMGVDGESLSEFVINVFRFMRNRRTLYRSDIDEFENISNFRLKIKKNKILNATVGRIMDRKRHKKLIKYEKLREASKEGKTTKKAIDIESYLDIEKIENGVIFTKDGRFLKILEIEPINFLLRSAREQRNIIYSFVSYLKIAPVKMQFKVIAKKADLNKHLNQVNEEMRMETDERCKMQQLDYIRFIKQIGTKEAVSRRFFLIYEYEPFMQNRKGDLNEMFSALKTAERTARNYFFQCGNEVIDYADESEFMTDVLYNLLNRTSHDSLEDRVKKVVENNAIAGNDIDSISVNEFYSPEMIDFSHMDYIVMDGLFITYMYIPSDGYKSHVVAGWMSLLVNAGEGIDVDFFASKQPKDKIQFKLGQQIRINRSKIKEASDTNTDFDDLEGAIRSGYFLKDGLANNEDFYYMNILVTVTAKNKIELEWRVNEMKKLLMSQDITIKPCNFYQEQAFRMTLPILNSEKKLYEKSKRNVLTTGIASCYPFTSFEISDDNGILLGVNKHNNSLVIVDIFNSKRYKNANMAMNKNIAVFGASGSMKSRAYVRNYIFQAARRGESLVITDPKSEMYEDMAVYLENQGYEVKVFNLVSPQNSDSWNCIADINGDDLMAQTFTDVVIKNTTVGMGDEFWDSASVNLLKALVLYVSVEFEGEDCNFGEAYKLISLRSASELDAMFSILDYTHPAYAPYNIFKQASDNVRSGIIIGLGARLQVFQNEMIRNITKYNEIDLVEAGKKKCAYFCITSDQDSTFDFLASLFFSFLFIRLVRFADNHGIDGKLPVPVNLVLDEFPNIGAIVDFKKKISTTRSRAINISVIFQNLAQLQNRYPDGAWQEILGNCDTQLFLGCTDDVTAKLVADRTGEVTVAVASKTKNLNSWRVSDYTPEYREARSIGKRKLLTPDEILRLPIKEALVIMRGQKVLKVTKYDYTNHPHSKLIVKKKASTHIPNWRKVLDEEYGNDQISKTSAETLIKEESSKVLSETVDEDVVPARITLNVKPAIKTPDDNQKDDEQGLSAVDRLRNKNKGGGGNGNKPKFSQIDRNAITKK